jgi:hypothetical protein
VPEGKIKPLVQVALAHRRSSYRARPPSRSSHQTSGRLYSRSGPPFWDSR